MQVIKCSIADIGFEPIVTRQFDDYNYALAWLDLAMGEEYLHELADATASECEALERDYAFAAHLIKSRPGKSVAAIASGKLFTLYVGNDE